MEKERLEALRGALERTPGSILALSKEAKISDRLIRMVLAGDRRCTDATLTALADALDRWSASNSEASHLLREQLKPRGGAK